tara:strand:+ start:744 stop:941 length:198 start_codon:yes stop_codon:yes gene_type:complete
MLGRLMLRLEILGYNRAIGHMACQPCVTQEMIDGLREQRDQVYVRLADLKKAQHVERFGRGFYAS